MGINFAYLAYSRLSMSFNSKQFAASFFKLALKQPGQEKLLTDQLILFCQRKNLTSRLANILKHLEQATGRYHDRQQLRLTSQNPLGPAAIQTIKQFIGASAAPVRADLDPTLTGGFVAMYNNKIYDASIKRQMERLKEKMVN